MYKKSLTLIHAAVLMCFVIQAEAATTINFMLAQTGQMDVEQTAYIDQGKILIKSAGGDPNMDLLFKQATETLSLINHADKTVMDLDAVKVAALANQAQGMMTVVQQQMQKQMENMSEAEQEQLKSMIENLGGGQLLQAPPPPPPPLQYKDKGVTDINGFSCRITEAYEGSLKVAEACTAEPDDVGIPAADFAVVEAMKAMSQKLRDQTAKISAQMGQNVPQFGDSNIPGVPVLMKDKTGNTMSITSIDSGIGEAVLSKPADYSPKQLPSLPQLTQ